MTQARPRWHRPVFRWRLVGPGVNQQRLGATGPDGSFSFPGLQAGPYQLIVAINATVAAALAANDIAYGGPATGYEFDLGVGETASQAIPFDITHTTINVAVTPEGRRDSRHADSWRVRHALLGRGR